MLLPELYQPMKVGPMPVGNRLMLAAMGAGKRMDANGNVTDRMIAYFAERAKGEPGMIALGAAHVVPAELGSGARAGVYNDRVAASLSRFVEAMRAYDTKIGIQIFDGGG